MKGKIIPLKNGAFQWEFMPSEPTIKYYDIEQIFCDKCNAMNLVWRMEGHWHCNVCKSLLGFPITKENIPGKWAIDENGKIIGYEVVPYILKGETEIRVE